MRIFFSLSLCAAFIIIYLGIFGNFPQVYTDVIIEHLAWALGNKSVEIVLINILIVAGSGIIYIYRNNIISFWENNNSSFFKENESFFKVLLSILLCVFFTTKIVNEQENDVILISLLLIVFFRFFLKYTEERICCGIIAYFTGVYCIIGLYRLYAWLGGNKTISSLFIAIIVSSIMLIIDGRFNGKIKYFKRWILLNQIFIPFVFFIFLLNRYLYNGVTKFIEIPHGAYCLIWFLLCILFILALCNLKKEWKNEEGGISSLISISAPISIVAFNQFVGTGAIMRTESHHTFENILGYSLIMQRGELPFEQYIPISGFYSLFNGFIYEFFGDGKYSSFYLSDNLMNLFIAIVVILLIWKNIDKKYVFVISLLFAVQDYNRTIFLLPIILILISPVLLGCSYKWIVLWLIFSLFQGLYYPLVGTVIFLGFLPLACEQFYEIYKQKGIICSLKEKSNILITAFAVCLLVVSLPSLSGLFKHMTVMASQSLLADGYARFSTDCEMTFLNFIPSDPLRNAIYLIVSFLIPALILWLFVALFLYYKNFEPQSISPSFGEILTDKENILHFVKSRKNNKKAYIYLAFVIILLVSYQSTFIGMGPVMLLGRHLYIILPVLFAAIVMEINKRDKRLKDVALIFVFVFLVAFCRFWGLTTDKNLSCVGINSIDRLLYNCYFVPQGYVYVKNNPVDRIGEGFLEEWFYKDLCKEHLKTKQDMTDNFYYAYYPTYGYYYLFDVKGVATLEAWPIKSFEAMKETINMIKKTKPYIGPYIGYWYRYKLGMHTQYYLYNWLLTSGEYIWNDNKGRFEPVNNVSPDRLAKSHENVVLQPEGFDLGYVSAAHGESFSSLRNIFQKVDMDYSIKETNITNQIILKKAIMGNKCDYIYIELDVPNEEGMSFYNKYLKNITKRKFYNKNKKLKIEWLDNKNNKHYYLANINNGRLLIPIGAGNKWLFNNHDKVEFSLVEEMKIIKMPRIKHIEFLKIRNIE